MYILLQGQKQYFSITIYLLLWMKNFISAKKNTVFQVYIRLEQRIQ